MEIWWSNKIQTDVKEHFKSFVQKMAYRLVQGAARYGTKVKKEQNYMTRLIMEVKAYKRTGNHEHLLNIANYAILESVAPENPKYHFDNTVRSVTR